MKVSAFALLGLSACATVASDSPQAAAPPNQAAALRGTAPVPRLGLDSYFSPFDYPDRALQARAEGRVAVLLDVGVDGRVTACTVTASSGNAVLDHSTCRILRSRTRFEPARDASGAAAPGRYAYERSWILPR